MKNKFIRIIAFVFGLIFLGACVQGLVLAVWAYTMFGFEDMAQGIAIAVGAISIALGISGAFLLYSAFRGRRGMGKTIS
ncbi:MAG TPA: hypothetical protein VMW64_05435 [Dehalococcoidia bacterium]|nr:hypothetical protein [Dehalococcoidia bacterium]